MKLCRERNSVVRWVIIESLSSQNSSGGGCTWIAGGPVYEAHASWPNFSEYSGDSIPIKNSRILLFYAFYRSIFVLGVVFGARLSVPVQDAISLIDPPNNISYGMFTRIICKIALDGGPFGRPSVAARSW
ncbi:hypothetical protein M408DRAFT_333219 [Serendipita vermifera MAFF 305830]|uniref:Uncharacterized protein n=1 Tax=Serendipita vermifera MAFF 305830 TaxID=933852 RepID=A0A0C2WWV3_SERVB|nr:hypothetical protein M408DRAFT_333219 [Serendipita vermifera MAFF 305830]